MKLFFVTLSIGVSISLLSAVSPALAAETSLPASYDLRKEGIITPIKDQGYSGACWAFSSLKSAESNAIRKGLLSLKNADFSENHLAWFSFHASTKASDPLNTDGFYPITNDKDAAYYWGGSALVASFTMARWSGIVLEKTAPFQANSTKKMANMAASMTKSENKLRYQAKFHLQNATCYDNADQNTIKEALMQKGALSVGLYYSKNHLHKGTAGTTYYQDDYLGARAISAANHCVTIVGWDDTFSRENFPESCRPGQDGAWLIANSYGTSVGDNGYFWLSYKEPSICDIYSFEVESADNYDTNYQYDGFGWGSALTGVNESVKGANIYTTESDHHQSLKAIGLYTIDDNQSYKIQIYKNVDKNKPTRGTLVSASTTTGLIPYNGFHTITLKKPVKLTAGSRFSVVVTYSNNPTGKNYLPIEGKGMTSTKTSTQSIYGSEAGQSFYYSTSERKWLDIAKNGYNNLCVKAYAKNISDAPVIQLTEKNVTLGKGETYRISPTLKNVKTTKIKYSSNKPSIAKVSKKGKITAKRSGTATIKIQAGNAKATLKVKVKKAPATITVKPTKKVIKKGKKYQIRTTLSAGSASHKLTFRSSKPSIATVNTKGKVTAKKAGTTVIHIRTYNGKTTKITIRVKA